MTAADYKHKKIYDSLACSLGYLPTMTCSDAAYAYKEVAKYLQ